ncbi:MAG: hypothetical protein ACP5D7_11965 [Limnospira sp.]
MGASYIWAEQSATYCTPTGASESVWLKVLYKWGRRVRTGSETQFRRHS